MKYSQNPIIRARRRATSNLLYAVGNRNKPRRKGSALVFSVFLVSCLLIVSAIAIDFGHISTSRSELKRTADAAAMSACWELFDGVSRGQNQAATQGLIAQAASTIAAQNTVSSRPPTVNEQTDVQIGYYDLANPGALDTSSPDKFNAVRVSVRQTEASGTAIPLFFGGITGRSEQSIETFSTAALTKKISGFYVPSEAGETIDILPIALDLETWEQVLAKQTEDVISYSNGTVESGSDGLFECSLYPTGTGSPGNRGTVDIGSSNNSTADLRRQILSGISAQDMAELGKPLEFDLNGELELNGDTGISAGIKTQLESIIGEPRIIPIFTKVEGNGNNATYTIVRFEGIRVLAVKLTGPMKKKHLTIQPCPMVARYSVYHKEEFEESEFLFTPVMLVE
ncbi:pilus assembly protein TadG-related protein [Stieleria sp. TO1_6]|uniref:TadG family pilus assembly protein n=1 Tax=Stieleria tagensis TaxID=2956795 RepID=UPI00209AE9E7|nr:TadG family pilus assembly protein [Stieleria tagensis]MCO8125407.1 pilus assembly protein TadG-related protein [Stieleria tagensis]